MRRRCEPIYEPTAEEIAQRAESIRRAWTKKEERERRQGWKDQHWNPYLVKEIECPD